MLDHEQRQILNRVQDPAFSHQEATELIQSLTDRLVTAENSLLWVTGRRPDVEALRYLRRLTEPRRQSWKTAGEYQSTKELVRSIVKEAIEGILARELEACFRNAIDPEAN